MCDQDQIIFKKAKNRVITRLFISWILLCLYFVGVFFVLNLDFLKVTANNLNTVIIVLAISQLCLFAFIFLLLSFGKKIFRILYGLVFLLSLSLFYIPIQFALEDMEHILTYSIMAGFMFIKTLFLIQLGSYLKKNKWSRIFFDWTIDIYEDDIEQPIPQPVKKEKPIKKIAPKKVEPEYIYEEYEEAEDEEYFEEEPYTQPQISIRLGIGIYASLMVFPILVQIFSNYFSNFIMSITSFIFCINFISF